VHVLEDHLGVAAAVLVAEDVRAAAEGTPGVAFGTAIIDCWRWAAAVGSVLPMTMKTWQRSFRAPELNHFLPLRTYSSPRRSMRRPMLLASEEPTSGSVMQKAERISPSSSGASQSRFTASDP